MNESISGENVEIVACLYPPTSRASSMSTASDMSGITTPAYVSELVRRFDFSSGLQRMSVICRNRLDRQFLAFVKGSPEKI